MKKRISFACMLGLMLTMISVCYSTIGVRAQLGNEVDVNVHDEVKNIVEVAIEDGRFNTLVAALKATGLDETLKGDGPYTVFAPTDEAFSKLPAGTVEELLKPENKDKLTNILLYHVLPTKVLSPDVVRLENKEIKMLNGKTAKVTIVKKEVFIDGAKVIAADIITSNGIIHVIDTVMLPE
ncbi:MAG TPA: fasciclin [Firmicutes bacterium]|nr:fasciclin [Bacillota bacterium]